MICLALRGFIRVETSSKLMCTYGQSFIRNARVAVHHCSCVVEYLQCQCVDLSPAVLGYQVPP